jgi:hypothetical protein
MSCQINGLGEKLQEIHLAMAVKGELPLEAITEYKGLFKLVAVLSKDIKISWVNEISKKAWTGKLPNEKATTILGAVNAIAIRYGVPPLKEEALIRSAEQKPKKSAVSQAA